MTHDFIYLASQSPRRRELLAQLGVRYELLLPDEHEDAEALEALIPSELPEAYVARVTEAKLDAAITRCVARGLPAAPILCSDTTVAVEAQILGKPLDAEDAAKTLRLLSGRSHRVITGVALGDQTRRSAALNVSAVTFAPISEAQLCRYVDSGEPFGKAGSYAIQSQAAAWVSHISGSYSGIMGLPLYETAQMLQQWDVRF
jgi:septum formation protein